MSHAMEAIPVIDISPLVWLGERGDDDGHNTPPQQHHLLRNVVEEIKNACETFGFFAVTNHGVDPDAVAGAWEASTNFFDSDPSIKSSVPMSEDYFYGYENHESLGIERSTASTSADDAGTDPSHAPRPDSKETFSIGPADGEKSGMPSRRFPRGAPEAFAPALTRYFDVMENLARILFRGLALALRLGDESWFLREGIFDEGHQCALRLLNYPQLEYARGEGPSSSASVHIRAGAHTDYGAMTILKSGGPGLQLQLSSGGKTDGTVSSDEAWIDVPHLSDAFIINLGDLMQRWTNDRWRSTLHRVIAVADDDRPDGNEGGDRVFQSARRQSIAFFVNMNGNATVVPFDSCIDDDHPSRYDTIKASDHLIQRHAQSMGNASKE